MKPTQNNRKKKKPKRITAQMSKEEKKLIRKERKVFRKERNLKDDVLAAVMMKYIDKSMPGKAFRKKFLKGYNLSNEKLTEALESPLGPKLEQKEFEGNKSYERLAEKVKAVVKLKKLNKNRSVKPILNSEAGFYEFSTNVSGFLTQMKDELNTMNKARKNQSNSSNISSAHNPNGPRLPWHSAQPNGFDDQKPSTSKATFDNESFEEDRTPMDNDEMAESLQPVDITKRYSQLRFRCDELKRYNPDSVLMSDCDQSGSEDEPEDFNKHFGQRLKFFEQQRKLEIVRNRPFGVQKPNNFQSKYLPSNSFRR